MAKKFLKAIVLDKEVDYKFGVGRYDVQITRIDDDVAHKEITFKVTLRDSEYDWGGISRENAYEISDKKGRNHVIIEVEENDRGRYDVLDIIPDDEKSKEDDIYTRNTLRL